MSWMFPHVKGRSKASVQHVRIYLCGIYKAFLCQVLPGTIYPRYVCQRPLPARWVLWKCHLNLYIYISLSLLPNVKIIHYFLRRKPYFNFEMKKSTQRPTKYYNSARSYPLNPKNKQPIIVFFKYPNSVLFFVFPYLWKLIGLLPFSNWYRQGCIATGGVHVLTTTGDSQCTGNVHQSYSWLVVVNSG